MTALALACRFGGVGKELSLAASVLFLPGGVVGTSGKTAVVEADLGSGVTRGTAVVGVGEGGVGLVEVINGVAEFVFVFVNGVE